MTTEIDFTVYTGPTETTEGEPVEIMFRNGRGKYPIGGYVGSSDNLLLWTRNGKYSLYGGTRFNLAPDEPVVTEYQNQYPIAFCGDWHESRKRADETAEPIRIGVLWRKRKGKKIIDAGIVGLP